MVVLTRKSNSATVEVLALSDELVIARMRCHSVKIAENYYTISTLHNIFDTINVHSVL